MQGSRNEGYMIHCNFIVCLATIFWLNQQVCFALPALSSDVKPGVGWYWSDDARLDWIIIVNSISSQHMRRDLFAINLNVHKSGSTSDAFYLESWFLFTHMCMLSVIDEGMQSGSIDKAIDLRLKYNLRFDWSLTNKFKQKIKISRMVTL